MKIKLERSNVQTIVELNMVQTGMLYHYLKDDKDNLYNIQLSLKITGDLDKDLLWAAFKHIQSQHEVLRSVFRWEETNKPIQIILKEYNLDLLFLDLSERAHLDQADLEEVLAPDKFERFDLTVLPLKIRLIKLKEDTHLLVITFHHILYDGWSNAILLKELFQTYKALTSGQNPGPSLKPAYAQVQTQIIKDTSSPDKEFFWKEYLKEVKPIIAFNQFNQHQHFSNSVSRLHIVPELGSLEGFVKENKITKAAIIYAAYAVLLKIYNGNNDVVFGTTVSNRNPSVSGIENIMGNFITTIPLRVGIDEQMTNIEFVQAVNQDVLDRNKFHNSSLYEINKLIDIPANIQLFDSVVGIENYPLEDHLINSVEGLNIEFDDIYENTHVPLVVLAFFKNNLELTFNYKSDIISKEVIQSFSKLLIEIIDKVIQTPNQKVADLILELNSDIEFLINRFNQTSKPFPEKKTIVDLFEENVYDRAGKKGLVFNEVQLSIEELNRKANQLAYGLISEGVCQGDLVVLMLEPSVEMVIGILGVLKAGAAYLPLDPDFPRDRISNICKQSDARLMVSRSGKTAADLPLDNIDLDLFVYDNYALENLNLTIDPDDNAYVIFTSGTTGSPKGVTISHKNLVNYCCWLKDFVDFGADEKTVLATSYAFDLGYTVLFPSLIFGAELHLLPKQKLQNTNDFLNYIDQHKISFLKLTPSLYATLCENQMFYKANSLRVIVLGGELIRIPDLEKTFETFENIKVVNHYGPTETTIGSIARLIDINNFYNFKMSPSLGVPVSNTKCFILNESLELVPLGAIGELYIAGAGLSKGYFNKEELTAEKFLPSRFLHGELMYKTGDLCKFLSNGEIQFIGRVDHQVKIRGYRVETLEIKNCVDQFTGIQDSLVISNKLKEDPYLISYVVSEDKIDFKKLKEYLIEKLPEYMIPLYFIQIAEIPLTLNGKIDLSKLPEPEVVSEHEVIPPADEMEKILLGIWEEVLGQDNISTDRNFFEIGGDSLKLIKVNTRIIQRLNCKVQITDFFEYPTIQKFGKLIHSLKNKTTGSAEAEIKEEPASVTNASEQEINDTDIAIIGMAVNLPGADHIGTYWNNLRTGKDSITRSFDEVSGGAIIRAKGKINDTDLFEASFFNYTPEEAATMDPQMRMFHECCWLALENSGYNPFIYEGLIGLYGGASHNPLYNVAVNSDTQNNWMDQWQDYIYSTKDFLCPRISYKLNLKGPSINISTACSTSLVAVDIACNDLITEKCDIALAGGVSLTFHDDDGYSYKKGMILSPDGFCRAFDKDAAGTVGGNGMGVVVLKKLKKALSDGDYIHAIIKGSARNNDGADKIGFMAPSIEGQTNVIKSALKSAKVSPETISYIEAHGTGTILGDPIEFKGLKMAYASDHKNHCALGSVKTNIGHLNAASGIAGLIKVVLALQHKQIPASLNFSEPNANMDLENSPFFINTALMDWKSTGKRRAGVSSFGIGGTNAHVILEEAPDFLHGKVPYSQNVLLLSGKTNRSLQHNIANLKGFLEGNPGFSLSDIAYTLGIGRAHFNYRAALTCNSVTEAINKLSMLLDHPQSIASAAIGHQNMVFMFPGQGAQYLNMCNDLYQKLPVFRQIADECFSFVKERFNKDLKAVIFAEDNSAEAGRLHETEFTQPLLFIVEFALAKTMIGWGINPDIMIGHSVGEYVAACISKVFSLEDALTLVVKRGELMQHLPSGTMLSINISRKELNVFLQNQGSISIAAVNTENSTVVSGRTEDILGFKDFLEKEGYACKIIKCSHAFHSYMMDAMLDDFRNIFSTVKINSHTLPFISNLNGQPVIDSEISTPDYWVKHLRNTVEFSLGINFLLENYSNSKFLEVGPGKTLSSYLRTYIPKTNPQVVLNVIHHQYESIDDVEHLFSVLGTLWSHKTEINWSNVYQNEFRKRVPLPGYSFDRSKVKNREIKALKSSANHSAELVRSHEVSDWFYTNGWKKSSLINETGSEYHQMTNLVFADSEKLSAPLKEKLDVVDKNTIYVRRGAFFSKVSAIEYIIRADAESDFVLLVNSLVASGIYPDRLIYCWTVDQYDQHNSSNDEFVNLYDVTLLGVLNIFKAYVFQNGVPFKQFVLFTNDLQSISGAEETVLDRVPVLGLLRSLSQEYPTMRSLHIDISLSDHLKIEALFKEIAHIGTEHEIAFRNSIRWVRHYEKVDRLKLIDHSSQFSGKVFLITGGLGDLGFHLAKYLMKEYDARIILTGRTDLSSTSEESAALKLSKLESLQKEGNVVYYACDIADLEQTIAISADIASKYGPINGIIHAAGIIRGNSKNLLTELEKDDFVVQFESKIKGIKVLKEVFGSRELDFCLISSSISTILGGIGFAAYSSANIYMDYFVNYHKDRSELQNWLSVNFDGLSLNSDHGDGIHGNEIGLTFEYLTSLLMLNQVSVSVADLNKRINTWVNRPVEDIPVSEETGEEKRPVRRLVSLGETETEIINIWKVFFGTEEVGVYDDFFDLGGDSLKALTMISNLYKAFGVKLSIRDLFNNPTILEISKLLETASRQQDQLKQEFLPITNAAIKPFYKSTSVQKRLYFLFRLEKESIAYNMPFCVKLTGVLDRIRLENAIVELIHRHENLRTTFIMQGDEPVQVISDQFDFKLEYVVADPVEHPELITDFIRPFDLGVGPLIRGRLISIGPGEHILLMDMHHIITDAVSRGILIRDFMSFYNGESLPALRLQYKDYSEWQLGDEQEEILSQKEFWQNEFSELPPVLELPYDFGRPAMKQSKGGTIRFEIGTSETRKLKTMAESEKTTMFMVMFSVYTILLSKLGGQEDIVVGVPISGRNHPDLESVMGMFVNTLPLRSSLPGNVTYLEYLLQLKARTLLSFDHQSYPYEVLLDELKVVRDVSRNPLFDVMFSYENFEEVSLEIPGLQLSSYPIKHEVSKLDLSLIVKEEDDKLYLNLEYSTALFTDETIMRFAGYLQKIVLEVTEDQNKPLSEIQMLSEREQNQLLNVYNDTASDFPKNKTLIDLFEEQVQKTPDHKALIFNDQFMTYRELNARSNQLARHLVHHGVIKGSIVGLMLDRSFEMIISIIAVMKVGGSYLPLDQSMGVVRIENILKESGALALLTMPDLGDENSFDLLLFNVSDTEVEKYETTNLNTVIAPTDAAYVLYTSGSSGVPKGVVVGHRSVINLITGQSKWFSINPEDRILQFSTISFDASVEQIWMALLNGIPLVLISKAVILNNRLFSDYLVRHRVTYIAATPSFLENIELPSENSLKHIVAGGEECQIQLAKRFYKDYNFYNAYGPTEVTVISTQYLIKEEDIERDKLAIGKPVNNIQVYVLGKYAELLPIGCPGELYISGDGLSLGYLHDAVLTADKFINNPYRPGQLMYKTGDMVRWREDGNIEFLGRIDSQIKLRGFRIELGDIVSHLLANKEIRKAVVIDKEKNGEKYLVAYYVSDQEIESSKLKQFLMDRLPEYMVPSMFQRLEEMPLNTNGKIERKALPEPVYMDPVNFIAPSSKQQVELIKIWADILNLEVKEIGVNTNFFDMGGNSLKMIRMVSEINQHFNIEIPVTKLFELPMIHLLSDYITDVLNPKVSADGPVDDSDFQQFSSTLNLINRQAD